MEPWLDELVWERLLVEVPLCSGGGGGHLSIVMSSSFIFSIISSMSFLLGMSFRLSLIALISPSVAATRSGRSASDDRVVRIVSFSFSKASRRVITVTIDPPSLLAIVANLSFSLQISSSTSEWPYGWNLPFAVLTAPVELFVLVDLSASAKLPPLVLVIARAFALSRNTRHFLYLHGGRLSCTLGTFSDVHSLCWMGGYLSSTGIWRRSHNSA